MSDNNFDPVHGANPAGPGGQGGGGFSLRPIVTGVTRLNNKAMVLGIVAIGVGAGIAAMTFGDGGRSATDAARNAIANQGKGPAKPADLNGELWYMKEPDKLQPAVAPDLASAPAASAPAAAVAGPNKDIPDLTGKANTLNGSVTNPSAPAGSLNQAQHGGAPGQVSAADQQAAQAAQSRQMDAQAATKSALAANGFRNEDATAETRAQLAAKAAAAAAGGGAGGVIPTGLSATPPDNDPNKQDRKEGFLKSAKLADVDYNPSARTAQLTPYEVKAGWLIPAVLIGGMNSDLPGQIIAQVRENVYDTKSGRFLLIPQGSRLIGKYDSYVAYGQRRALVAWSRLIYPDGSSYNLRGMPGADGEGFAGFSDQVDNHYARIFGTAILMSLITAGAQLSQPNTSTGTNGQPSATQTAAGALGQQLGQTGMQMTQKNLNIQPTLEIRPGYRFNVMVTADMALPRIDS